MIQKILLLIAWCAFREVYILKRYFYCYSKPLKDFLLDNGERYIIKAIHEKTKKKYWLFEGTEKINKLLDEWRLRKK